jgi:hypothetical protein
LVFIDDATSKILAMHFELTETTIGYLRCLEKQLDSYGRPVAFYSDKHTVFKVTRTTGEEEVFADTQFHRALKSLSIELICAHSSQAKGRVERANKTLQDRLIKEMRLRSISTLSKANAYLPEFIAAHNKKFAVIAAKAEDAHRPICHSKAALRRILSVQETRKLTKNLEFSYNNTLYQVLRVKCGFHLRHAMVTICEHIDNTQEVLYGDTLLRYKKLSKPLKQPIVANTKELNPLIDGMIKKYSKERSFPVLPTSAQPIQV